MGNCLFLRAQGWGIDRQMKTKLQIPGGMPGGGGGMVTGRIEPCIIQNCTEMLVRFRKREATESRYGQNNSSRSSSQRLQQVVDQGMKDGKGVHSISYQGLVLSQGEGCGEDVGEMAANPSKVR